MTEQHRPAQPADSEPPADQAAPMDPAPDPVAPEARPVPENDRSGVEDYEPTTGDPEVPLAQAPDDDDPAELYPHAEEEPAEEPESAASDLEAEAEADQGIVGPDSGGV